MPIAPDSRSMWSAYAGELEKLFGGNIPESAVIHPLLQLKPMNSTTKRSDRGGPELNLYRKALIADTMPLWGPTYIPSDSSVSNGYSEFLNFLNGDVISKLSTSDKATLKRLNDIRQAAVDKLVSFENEVTQNWNSYRRHPSDSPPLTRAQWEDKFQLAPRRELLKTQVNEATGSYIVEARKNPDLLVIGNAVGALTAPSSKMLLPEDPDLVGDRESWTPIFKSFINGELEAFQTGSAPERIEITERTQKSTRFESRWEGSASFGYGFFSIGGGASGGSIEEHFREDASSFKLSFRNLNRFQIRRGNWYNGALIRDYGSHLDYTRFFGPMGILNLVPLEIILGTGLKLEIACSQRNRDEFHSWRHAEGGAGFRFGPWSIGGSASSTSRSDQVTITDINGSLKIEDNSGEIFLLAVANLQTGYYIRHPERLAHEVMSELNYSALEDTKKIVSELTDKNLLGASLEPQ